MVDYMLPDVYMSTRGANMAARKKAIFTTKELMERYGNTLRTIQHWQRTKGFPMGDFVSKTYHFPYEGVIAWEKIHMPHLHSDIHVDEDPEQAALWRERARQHALDREGGGDEEQKPQRSKKAKRPRGRKK